LFVGLCAPLVHFISSAEDACICWVTTIVVLMFVFWVLSVDGVRLTVGLAALAVHLEEGRADFWGDGIHAKQILPTRTARVRIPLSPQVRQNQTMERIYSVNVWIVGFVVLDTSPRRRCVPGTYVRCVDQFYRYMTTAYNQRFSARKLCST
jgi:hypothetical protein